MSRHLKTIRELFSETWQLYTERAFSVVLVVLITTAIVFVVISFAAFSSMMFLGGVEPLIKSLQSAIFSPQLIITASGILLLFMVLIIWSQTATLVISIDESMGVGKALKAGWKYFLPVTWVGSLYLGVVVTGLTFFVIPGIMFGLSMCLCLYALFDDDLQGMDALAASHLFIRGHWWNTLGKLLPVWGISIAVGQVPFVGMLLSILTTPFLLFYMLILYRDLKQQAEGGVFQTPRRGLWWFMAIIGMLLPLLGLLGAIVTVGPQLPGLLKDMQQGRIPGVEWPRFDDVMNHNQERKKPPVVTRLPSVNGYKVWNDPVGDTSNPLLDVQEVAVQAGNKRMRFKITLADSFDAYFAETDRLDFKPLLSLYLDTDVDRTTGGKTRGEPGRGGYEYAVDIILERQLAENKVQIALYRLEGDQRHSLGTIDGRTVNVSGNELTFRIAAERIAIRSGSMIRVCFYEFGQQQGSSLAKDKLIPY